MASSAMLHPDQFAVDEAWVAFRVNEAPMSAMGEGDFNCIALIDAASCFILGNVVVSSDQAEPSKSALRRLFREATAHKGQLPKTLFVPDRQFLRILPAEADRVGVEIVRVPEEQLLLIIGEARASFREHFNGARLQ